jgi:peptide/nickel transport system ATP-binding protein
MTAPTGTSISTTTGTPTVAPKVTGEKTALLTVRDLQVEYRTSYKTVRAVDHVSFEIHKNEVLGLAGESGCGKSTAAHAVTRILKPPAYITGGEIVFNSEGSNKGQPRDILRMTDAELRDFRWQHLSIVFQSAMNALNPVLTVGTQIIDAIQAHTNMPKQKAWKRAEELLDVVGIDPKRITSYPHQLSGGMRQRVVIAIALALNPELVVLDEPTTALDVVVQKEIMQEIQRLKKQFGFSVLFITHDLSLLVEFSDRIAIMYAGQIVETAPSAEIFATPKHPYTQRLMNSFPTITGPRRELTGIPGAPPDLSAPPQGCRFAPRCPVKIEGVCDVIPPELIESAPNHKAACHLVNPL